MRRLASARSPRALVNEILSLQLALTALIGVLAIAALFWTTKLVLQDNISKWATQWTMELDELAVPLYLTDGQAAALRIEQFIQNYPEIDRVTYFQPDGRVFFSVGSEDSITAVPPALDPKTLAELTERAASTTPYVVEDDQSEEQLLRIRGPIWTESIVGDGLFDYDPDAPAESKITTVGFVSLVLNFSWHRSELLSNVRFASVALILLLIVSGLTVRFLLKRALASLSKLQEPIEELAKGNLDVKFEPARHREISAITEALETTTAALRERDARLSQLANFDSLTGLYNRHRFEEELKNEIETVASTGKYSALFFIDLDQFKYVNDTCGHPTGDRLLTLVARQLRQSMSPGDVVARFGGDEFTIIAHDVSRRKAKTIGTKILDDMRRLAHIDHGNVFHAQCSIGIAMINSDRYDIHELLAQSDVACHEAKSRGRNRMEFYKVSARETEQMAVDVGWMQRIRKAIANDNFVLHYQPIVRIQTGQTTHHEVLLRMQDDDGRLVYPDVFLPAATRFGLMADLDRFLIEKVFKELSRFRVDNPKLRFTINLSGHAFEDKDFVAHIKILLQQHILPPGSVVFEITEQTAVSQLVAVDDQMAALREMGCQLAIDDFGTGYSSFGYLKRLPADYIKIDGSFIKDLARDSVDQTMVRLIGEIGKAAGMATIAEHVDDATALSLLAKYGIDYAQGFYVARPAETPEQVSIPVQLQTRRQMKAREAGK